MTDKTVMSGHSNMAAAHGAYSKPQASGSAYLGVKLVDDRRDPQNEVERISLFQDARRLEGDLSTQHLFDQWGPTKNERLDMTDLMPRSSIRGTMQFPYAPPQWFEQERQLQKDAVAASRGPMSEGGGRVGELFSQGYSLHDARWLAGKPSPLRLSTEDRAYGGLSYASRAAAYPSEAVADYGGGIAAGTEEMLASGMGSFGVHGDMVRGSLPFRDGPIRMHSVPMATICSDFCGSDATHKACSMCAMAPMEIAGAMQGIPPASIKPAQNPTAFSLDKHSYQSYRRGLPVKVESHPRPPAGYWDANGYLKGVRPAETRDGRIASGLASPMRLGKIPSTDIRSSPESSVPWAEPRGSQPWVSKWGGADGKDVYDPKGLSADPSRKFVSHEYGDESECDWGAELFLAWNPRSEQYQCTTCPPGHRPAFAQCVPVKPESSPVPNGKNGGRAMQ